MGACCSAPSSSRNLIEDIDGTEDDYYKRYLEDSVLGQGEFGIVKLVHDVSRPASPALACKILRKGVVFKDNVLMAAIKPHILKGEVEILRELNGENYCLNLLAIYESARNLFMITEFCGGGMMMEYVVQTHLDQELRTEDVSRIVYQLLSAVSHCSNHRVIHRDIKPENCMFIDSSPSSELRLIDFGSGCLDKGKMPSTGESSGKQSELIWHTTYAGSAFYTSPEMFQRTYTEKTDVWSVGVTLYVLVAGYPADHLQKAFNILHTGKNRRLQELPNLPKDLPDSFYELLGQLLTYKHKQRPRAGDMLQQEFVQFHKDFEKKSMLSIEDIAAEAYTGLGLNGLDPLASRSRTQSVALSGTQQKHSLFLGFKRFERSLTTLLATMLSKNELNRLLELLHARIKEKQVVDEKTMFESKLQDQHSLEGGQTLLVVQVGELKEVLKANFESEHIIETLDKLPYAAAYSHFAYHVALLSDFVEIDLKVMSGLGSKRNNSFSYLRKSSNAGMMTDSVGSRGSVQSLVLLNRNGQALRKNENLSSRSVQGGNIFAKLLESKKRPN